MIIGACWSIENLEVHSKGLQQLSSLYYEQIIPRNYGGNTKGNNPLSSGILLGTGLTPSCYVKATQK